MTGGRLRRTLHRLLVAFAALVVALLALELTLQWRDTGPAPLFVHEDGRVRLAPRRGAFVPVDIAAVPDRLRIVSMGASTIVGVPYEPALTPPRWLALVLARRGVRAEVVSVAAPGLDSGALLELLPAVLELQPDALVIATGHNEYLGATQLLRRRWWHELRLGAFFGRLQRAAQPDDELMPTPEQGFDHTEIVNRFRRNVRAMQALADDAGVPLLLCAEVSNLADFPPVLGDDPAADEDADAAYARGRALLAAGDLPGADAALQLAHDRDRWPHRANSALNAVVREEAHRFVALDRLFAEQSAQGIPGFDLFADHCHPNPAGQRLMAVGIADALEDLKLFPITGRRGKGPPLAEGLALFGGTAAVLARADAHVGRALTGFALMRGTPGPLADVARGLLLSARESSASRAGEVLAGLSLLDLLGDDPAAAAEHIAACRAASPDAIVNLQRQHDRYPWVTHVFRRNGLELRDGELITLPP